MVADVDVADASAAVRITLELSGLRAEDVPLTVRALGFHGAVPERLEVEGRAVALDASAPRTTVGRIAVEPDRDGRATVALRYRVAGAVDLGGADARVRIPLLAPAFPPAASGPGLFEATLRAPAEWRVTEGFPSTLRPGGSDGVWRVDLAVVPAMVSFRARTDGRWRPGLAGWLDVLALTALVGFFVVAGHHLARTEG